MSHLTSVFVSTIFSAACILVTQVAHAAVPEPVQACQDAVDAFASDPKRALEDAIFCVERLRQVEQDAKATQFKDEIDGWVGGALNKEMIMGMSGINRAFTKDGKTINVQLLGVADQSNPLGALAGLAQLGAMGGRKVRFAGNNGSMQVQGQQITINITNREGGTTIMETSTASEADIMNFGRKFYE